MSKLAVIDLGTNVINVLVGNVNQQGYDFLYEEKITRAIFDESLYAMHISLKEQRNIIDTLLAIKKKLDINGAKFIIAKATSFLRDASNAAHIIESIRFETDIDVEIISGMEEATLIYGGISACFTLTDPYGLIIDIGGGSVESIIFNHFKPLWQKSFDLGIRRVASQFTYSDPITQIETGVLEAYYKAVLEPLFLECKQYKPTQLIGSSGAFRTLLILYKYYYNYSHMRTTNSINRISREEFLELYAIIQTTPAFFWQRELPIEPVFLKLLPLSAILIKIILGSCNLQQIIVSDNSLRTGLFIREWNRLKAEQRI